MSIFYRIWIVDQLNIKTSTLTQRHMAAKKKQKDLRLNPQSRCIGILKQYMP